MILTTTTDSIEGREVAEYLGVVSGECVYGPKLMQDWFNSLSEVIGGYEKVLREGKEAAMQAMIELAEKRGADAIVGIDLDYGNFGEKLLMVSANGTAVKLR